jgi:hypothetical protein
LTEHEHPCLTAKKEPAASGRRSRSGEARSLFNKFYPNITELCIKTTTVAQKAHLRKREMDLTFYSEIVGENLFFS